MFRNLHQSNDVPPPGGEISLRREVRRDDPDRVRVIIESSGFFSAEETAVAVELVQARLSQGPASGYEFVLADRGDETVGYACYGPIPCTVGSYDLYWIAVRMDFRGHGIGGVLMERVEREIAASGGRAIYVETASRQQYEPTRRFYERFGYVVQAQLSDFYAPGDDKVIYVKRMG